MRIHIKSNFFIPGLENEESVDLHGTEMTLREFLDELSRMSPDRVEYVEPGARALDPDDWEVDINGIPYQNRPDGLQSPLQEGDTVTIRILAQGGG
jgi:hypothetical protein